MSDESLNRSRGKKDASGETCVKIPLRLLIQTIDLLENVDPRNIPNYDKTVILDYEAVLSAFSKKKASLDLRQSYANIIFADNEDERFAARMLYLQQKREISDCY